MPALHYLDVNFNNGELSPLMVGRVDFEGYRSACVQMENFMVRPYGGAFKMPGTQYVGEVKDSTKRTRLLPLKISRTENYLVEVGAGYFRFWKENDPAYLQVKSGYSVPAWAVGTQTKGSLVSNSGTNYIRTADTGTDSGTFASNLSSYHALTGGIIEWPNNYTETQLPDIQWRQINRLTVVVHPSHEPLIIESVPVDSLTNDFFQNTAWSDAATTAVTNSFMVGDVTFTFPPLAEHPLSGEGGTVTATLSHSAWATTTVYAVGNLRHVSSVVYYCLTAHTSGTFATDLAAVKWRLATGEEVIYNLTASASTIFTGLAVNDGFTIEPAIYQKSAAQRGIIQYLDAAAGVIRTTDAVFIQGGFLFSTQWLSNVGPNGSIQLQKSEDGVTFEVVKEWVFEGASSSTVSYEDTAPLYGAFYRISHYMLTNTAAGPSSIAKLEPLTSLLKLPFTVVGLTSSTVVTAKSALNFKAIMPIMSLSASATTFYTLAFSDDNGYPSAVGIHNLRLWFGGTSKEPNKVRGSAVDDFFNFATGDADGDAFDITLNSNEANAVQWIAGYKQGLVIGTEGEEWTVQGGGDGSEVLKPTNIQAIQRNRSGSKKLSAIQTRDALLWVSLTGRKVYEFAYVFASDNYEAPDMTLRAEHISTGGIEEVAFQNEPDPVLWCVTGAGKLIGFSYNRSNQITAWFNRTTDGLFESVATVRSSGNADRVWCIVKRTINGTTKRYIERFYPTAAEFDFSTASDFCYLDCAKKITQASSTAVSGLSHLEAKAVKVWHSGVTIESKTVASGAITLGTAATTMFVGLPMSSTLQPMPIEQVLQDGTSQGRRFNAQRLQLILHKSMGGTLSNDPALTGDAIGYPSGISGVYTGRVDEHISPEWLDALTLTFKHSDPTPFNVLGFVLKAEISGQ
jgi:hypothetical protein